MLVYLKKLPMLILLASLCCGCSLFGDKRPEGQDEKILDSYGLKEGDVNSGDSANANKVEADGSSQTEANNEAPPKSSDPMEDLFADSSNGGANPKAEDSSNMTSAGPQPASTEGTPPMGEAETGGAAAGGAMAASDMTAPESTSPAGAGGGGEMAATEVGGDDSSAEVAGSTGTYKVQKNETLMWISYKLYGDYSKWRQLAKLNPGVMGTNHSVKAGTMLKHNATNLNFSWKGKGTPYLILNGDTLSRISHSVYKTPAKWKFIFENNRKMIKNPNLIYAGFTLFYKALNDLASFTPSSNKVPKKLKVEAPTVSKNDVGHVNYDDYESAHESSVTLNTLNSSDANEDVFIPEGPAISADDFESINKDRSNT